MNSLEEFSEKLKTLKNKELSTSEYWDAVNKISEQEQKAFDAEEKKLQLSHEVLHRPFTI